MWERLSSLFVLKNGFEAGIVIYALAMGGAARGLVFVEDYPGVFGWLLFSACMLTVLIAGASIVDGVKAWRAQQPERRALERVVRRARAG